MASIKSAYSAIDIHRGKADAWPESIPELTAGGAINAARRLYRFAMGETWKGDIVLATGNRRAIWHYWDEQGRMFFRVNPSKGWREFVHDASHMLDYLANGESSHSKHHARFEAKLVREVIKRGWLESTPEDKVADKIIDEVIAAVDPRIEKLARLDARLEGWQRKRKRAENAIAKIMRSYKATERAMAKGPLKPKAVKPPAAPKPKAPTVRELAALHGIEIEPLAGGGYNVWPGPGVQDDAEGDPFYGDHCCLGWAEVRAAVKVYAALCEKSLTA